MSAARGELMPHVTADTVLGPMLLPAGDEIVTKQILDTRTWEPAETAALIALIGPGAHVIDVGAHVGYMTRLSASLMGSTGSVLAVEAHPGNFGLLQANVELGPHADRVRVVHGAAWSRSDEQVALTISHENSGDHRAYRRPGAEHVVEVRSIAIDDLLAPDHRVDVIKVDTQGTDHIALEGMRSTLARWSPTLLVEFWPPGIEELGDVPASVLALYRDELGYEIVPLEFPGLTQELGGAEELARIVEEARRCPGEFCTLLLRRPWASPA